MTKPKTAKVAPKPTLEQLIIMVLTKYKQGEPVDVSDDMVKAVVNKMVRKGMLNRSVADGKVNINDYGLKILGKMEMAK